MPQTLLALLSIVVVTLLSLSQQRALLESNRAMLDDEAEVMAAGIAIQTMEYIGTRAYDEKTRIYPIDNPNQLTSVFPEGKKCDLAPPITTGGGYDECAAIEDFNKITPAVVPFVVGKDTLKFKVSVRVTYVDANRKPTSTPSYAKEVTVTVQDIPREGGRNMLRNPIHIPRVFAYKG